MPITETKVQRNVLVGGEPIALVVSTTHDGGIAVMTTAIHTQNFARRIGGARFWEADATSRAIPDATIAEASELATAMSSKTLSIMISADGEKSVCLCDKSIIADPAAKARVLAEHARAVVAIDSGIIIGPDINNPESTQELVYDVPGLADHVTGLTARRNGLAIDERGYTAEGVVAGIIAAAAARTASGQLVAGRALVVAIEGFGAVGSHVAQRLQSLGYRIAAVSTALGCYTDLTGHGLDTEALVAARGVGDEVALHRFALEHPETIATTTRIDLFSVPADVLVPAAGSWRLASASEVDELRSRNSEIQEIRTYLEKTGVSIIACAANCPITRAAEDEAYAAGASVLIDYVLNSGGLLGCWREWEARHLTAGDRAIDLDALHRVTIEEVRNRVRENVDAVLTSGLPPRVAADALVERNRKLLMRAGTGHSAASPTHAVAAA